MSERTTYITGTGSNSEIASVISSMSPGVYHSSEAIRNEILRKNLGKYEMYKESVSATGGEAIGEAYSIGDELHPIAIGDNGLYGYTHDSKLPDTDPLFRNENIKNAFYDYIESEDVEAKLNAINHGLPWNDQLYGRSDVATKENSVKFTDYRNYMKSMFRWGLSFETSLSNTVNSLMFNGYTKSKTLVNDITQFIDSYQGTILDPVPTDWSNGDTQLGYIGKKMVENQGKLRNGSIAGSITDGIVYERMDNTIYKKGVSTADLSTIPWADGTQVPFSITDGSNEITTSDSQLIQPRDINTAARKYNIENNLDLFSPWKAYANFMGGKLDEPVSFNVGLGGVINGISPKKDITSPHGRQSYSFYDEGDTIPSSDGTKVLNITGEDSLVYGSYTRETISNPGILNSFGDPNKSLLQKTRKLFREHKIKTLISRFHTSADDGNQEGIEETQTAVTGYGISHGRNLLKKLGEKETNNYDNPYCRVWTYHHQYSRMDNLIRPFSADGGGTLGLEELQKDYPGRPILSPERGGKWNEKSVLNRNGMVNIAPMYADDFNGEKVKIKQCMFSIENLAWKGIHGGSDFPDSEKGPLGGRIMWFPPYDLSFSENASVQWHGNDFIGRGEKIYTYANTERSGTLSFTIVADHPSVIDYWTKQKTGGRKMNDEELQQDLLRFFAGCDNLEFEVDEPQVNQAKDQQSTKKNNINEQQTIVEDVDDDAEDNFYCFYLFFPNNLSGKDYMGSEDEVKQMANYLMYGKHKEDNIKDGYDNNIVNTTTNGVSTNGVFGYEVTVDPTEGITDNELSAKIIENNPKYPKVQPDSEPDSKYIWGYGRNKDTAGQKLVDSRKSYILSPSRYIDGLSMGLNTNRGSLFEDPDVNCSFADMYIAMQLKNQDSTIKNYLISSIGLSNGLSTADAKKLVDEIYNKLFNSQNLGVSGNTNADNEKRKIYYCVSGGASSQGYSNKNQLLAKERAEYLKKWIESVGGGDWVYSGDTTATATKIRDAEKVYDSDDREAKLGRMAKVKVWWPSERVAPAAKNVILTNETGTTETTGETVPMATISRNNTRYGDEYNFFKELKSTDQILYKNIVDKIKYFDPAFHSITPEGFNGRLAFLHQCTRQGNTMDASSPGNQDGYAGNLSFGRPPVCVLRLGDFYNTRIIINSMNIQFENGQWDLNPEGIGVQPMLAKINLSFVFQGGSSLGGPVTRLQNAISFNYYANQEVYDDRADVMKYGDNHEVSSESIFWVPGLGRTTTVENTAPESQQEAQEVITPVSVDDGVHEAVVNEAIEEIEGYVSPDDEEMIKLGDLVSEIDSGGCLTKAKLTSISSATTFGTFADFYEKESLKNNTLVEALVENCHFSWLGDWDNGGCVNYNKSDDLKYIIENIDTCEEWLSNVSYFRSKEKMENAMKTYLDFTVGASFFSRADNGEISQYLSRVVNNPTIPTNSTATMLLYSLTFANLNGMSDSARKGHLESLGVVFDTEKNLVSFNPEKIVGKNKALIFSILKSKFSVSETELIQKLKNYEFE